MELDRIRSLITKSSKADWHVISCNSSQEGPTYRDMLASVGIDETGRIQLEVHHRHAVYKPDVALSITSGLTIDENLNFPWAEVFRNAGNEHNWPMQMYCADVFYNAALVERVRYTIVDGEAAVPVPRTVGGPNGSPWTTNFEASLVNLIYDYCGNPLSGYIEDAGIVTIG